MYIDDNVRFKMIDDVVGKTIKNKEKIFVKYHGGSQAGKARELGPISFCEKTGQVRARCYHTNQVKTFMSEKMEILNQSEFDLAEHVVPVKPLPDFKNLEQVYEYYRDTLDSLGWGVISDEQLSVHHYYKNGKMKRGPVVSLSFFLDDGINCIEDSSGYNLDDIPPNKRPWSVHGKGFQSVNFRNLSSAAVRFMEFVQLSEPQGCPVNNVIYDLYSLNEIQLIENIIKIRKEKNKESFDRLKDKLIVPSVSFDSEKQVGSLNNSHWKYDVGYAFRDALDLMFQQRIEDKKAIYMWTQGPLISFKEGDTLTLRDGSMSMQVKYASPMGWDSDRKDMYYGNVTYQVCKKINSYWKYDDKTHSCTQLEFLNILINGIN